MPPFNYLLTPAQLSLQLQHQHLTLAQLAAGTFSIDKTVLVSLDDRLQQQLAQWPAKLQQDAFHDRLQALLQSWLQVYQQDGQSTQLHQLLATLKFRYRPFNPKDQAFQWLLQALLFEASRALDQFRLEFVEHHDLRSGLPNSSMMHHDIDQAHLDGCDLLGLVLISFRVTTNLTSGYRSADPELISEVIKLIRQHLPEHYKLYQLDVAEFGIVMPNLDSITKLNLLAAKMQRAFELTLHINQKVCALTPTIAAVYQQGHGYQAAALYAQARLTLEDASNRGHHFEIYTADIDQRASAFMALRDEVIDAFENDRFELFLQPIVDLGEKRCGSAEGLLRCRKRNGDFIPPPVVIDTLYKQGFGSMFLRWLMSTACRMGSELRHKVGHPVRLSINLAAEDLIDTELPYLLQQSLELWGMQPEMLTLEITENGLLLDEELANRTILQLVDMGCSMALDDFGTGYSSMTRLRAMPLDFVKLDQSFVRNLRDSSKDYEIVRAIVMLAHALDKQVVAEGVEDMETLRILEKMGCMKIQGYFFLHPVAFKDFITWANTFTPSLQ